MPPLRARRARSPRTTRRGPRQTWSRPTCCAPKSSSSTSGTRSSRCSRAPSRGPRSSPESGCSAPADADAYAHDLYANLRTLDAANADVILIETVPPGDAWLAVRDRLVRATRGVDDDRDWRLERGS